MTHIICPHCGKIATVTVTGERSEAYEAVLSLPYDMDEMEEMVANHNTYISENDESLLDHYDVVETDGGLQEFSCTACGEILSREDVFTAALEYMAQIFNDYIESGPSASRAVRSAIAGK